MIQLIKQRIAWHIPDFLQYITPDQLNLSETYLPDGIKKLQVQTGIAQLHGKSFTRAELDEIIADPDKKIQGISKSDFFQFIYDFIKQGIDDYTSGIGFFNQQALAELYRVMPDTIFSFKISEFLGSRDESVLMAERMGAVGFKVMYSIVDGATHDYPFFSSILGGINPNNDTMTLDWIQEIQMILQGKF